VIISYPSPQKFGGGIVTTSGANTIHTFTTSGTLSPLSTLSASYLIVAGGGGGGNGYAGGGGAGGLLSGSGVTIDTNSIYLVTVGAGGNGCNQTLNSGTNGTNSSFSMVSTAAVGGGFGGNNGGTTNGASGGSGGGGGGGVYPGGTGTSGQGNAGGSSGGSPNFGGGGGGGAGAVGATGTTTAGGNGGNGVASSISGTSITYAGGGGGSTISGGTAGLGGSGGGGNAGTAGATVSGVAGTTNLGGGGGAASGSGSASVIGGAGGSGIVIISYAGATQLMAGGTVTISGGNVIHTFTSSGYLTPIDLVNNSLRFRASASAYLNRTPPVASNRKTWTWSGWVKRGALSVNHFLFTCDNGSSDSVDNYLFFNSNNKLEFSGFSTTFRNTTAVYRDPASWYHIVFVLDTTQATDSNRMQLYVNGVQVTAFDNLVNPTQNTDLAINQAVEHRIGIRQDGTFPFDGYMTDINFIDGQALTPNSFGTFNNYGVWQPITYGGSYGTNGFYLPFTNTASTTTLGYDFSPQGNNWTTNNISLTAGSTYDSMTDVPTLTSTTAANYPVLNPLDTGGTAPSAGNLQLTAGAAEQGVRSTFAIPTTGKFYMEAVVGTNQSGATDIAFGLVARTTNLAANPSSIANGWLIYGVNNTTITRNGTNTLAGAGTALVAGDILQIAVDLANNKGWIGKNNTWFNGSTGTDGNPSTGANPTFTFSSPPELFVLAHCYSSTINVNFGQQPWVYTAPSGFLALNTFNL
jgi:hypothetical protein